MPAARWSVTKNIVTAWVVTMPASGPIAAVFCYLGGAFDMLRIFKALLIALQYRHRAADFSDSAGKDGDSHG